LEGYIVHATFGNRNILAEMMLLFLPFQFIVQKNQINKKSKLLLWCLVFLSILFLILTESRSCWLAFILASLFILCFIFSPQKIKNLLLIAKKQNQKTFWLLVLISVAGLVYALDRVQGRLAYTLLNPNNFNSINERFMWWGKTVEMIKDYPFLGVGPGNWKIILPQYGLTGTRAEEGLVYFTQPHNDFLWIAAESGIIALLMYLLFLFHLVFIAIRILKKNIFSENEKALSGAVLFGLVSYITISSFAFPKDRMEHLIVLAIYAAILISIYCRKMINVQDFSLKKVVLVFCVLLFCSVVGIMNMKGDYHAKKAEQYRLSGNYNKVIEEASIAKNYFYTVTPQAIPVEYLSGIALYHKGNYKEAICFFESALNKNPNHILSLYFLATSFAMEENEISAVDYYQKVLVISNKLDIANVNLAISYFNLGKFKEALARLSLIKNMQHVKSNIELIKNVLIKNGYPQAEKWSDYKIEVFFKELAKNRNP